MQKKIVQKIEKKSLTMLSPPIVLMTMTHGTNFCPQKKKVPQKKKKKKVPQKKKKKKKKFCPV